MTGSHKTMKEISGTLEKSLPRFLARALRGSWEVGVKGAKAGIITAAQPEVGDKYQQEVAKGEAEDGASV